MEVGLKVKAPPKKIESETRLPALMVTFPVTTTLALIPPFPEIDAVPDTPPSTVTINND